jgi:hypothetical protein
MIEGYQVEGGREVTKGSDPFHFIVMIDQFLLSSLNQSLISCKQVLIYIDGSYLIDLVRPFERLIVRNLPLFYVKYLLVPTT